jgi:sensor c-di-GMP phosphodiesterase-like protein
VRGFSKKLIGVVLGVLLAGGPMLIFNHWLNGLIVQQSQDEVNATARRSVTVAEALIGEALDAVRDLAQRGIATCAPEHLDELRRANLDFSSVTEFSVVSPAGRTLCSDLGVALRHRIVMTTEMVADSNAALDVMMVDDRPQKMLRVRKPTGGNAIAALIPGDLLLTKVATHGGLLLNAHGRIATEDGTTIATVGPLNEFGSFIDKPVVSVVKLQRYGLSVIVTRPSWALTRGQEEMKLMGTVVNAVIACALLAIGFLVPWRQRNNPVVEMERALKAGEFVPYYQPVFDITTGRMSGCEVLMRWKKPDGTMVPPVMFIPLAESSGLIMDMTRSLMRRVCQELGAMARKNPNFRFGFNLAAGHFAKDTIVSDVREIFGNSQIPFSQVMLEVTERQPLEDLVLARSIIKALQDLGVKIAIDDIGAGHSGLSYVLKLGVDVIKLDKIFVDALGTETSSATIIETLVDLAKNMRLEIIAEGVETFEQVVVLRERGIRCVQGYVFAPPLPGASLLRLMDVTGGESVSEQDDGEGEVVSFGYRPSRKRVVAA